MLVNIVAIVLAASPLIAAAVPSLIASVSYTPKGGNS